MRPTQVKKKVYIYNQYLLNKLQFIIKINRFNSCLSKVLILTRYRKNC